MFNITHNEDTMLVELSCPFSCLKVKFFYIQITQALRVTAYSQTTYHRGYGQGRGYDMATYKISAPIIRYLPSHAIVLNPRTVHSKSLWPYNPFFKKGHTLTLKEYRC